MLAAREHFKRMRLLLITYAHSFPRYESKNIQTCYDFIGLKYLLLKAKMNSDSQVMFVYKLLQKKNYSYLSFTKQRFTVTSQGQTWGAQSSISLFVYDFFHGLLVIDFYRLTYFERYFSVLDNYMTLFHEIILFSGWFDLFFMSGCKLDIRYIYNGKAICSSIVISVRCN